jgi:hypothetical protein
MPIELRFSRTFSRKTFAEHLDAATAHASRTKRLGDLQHHLALALGGEAGAVTSGCCHDGLPEPSIDPTLLAVDDGVVWGFGTGSRHERFHEPTTIRSNS